MINLTILDVVISLLLVFFILSTITSSLLEVANSLFGKSTRSKLLYDALSKVFNDRHNKNWCEEIYQHPLVEASKKDFKSLPAYIDPKTFSAALVDTFTKESRKIAIEYKNGKPVVKESVSVGAGAMKDFTDAIGRMNASDVKLLMQSFLANSTAGDITSLKANIENWFNGYMDRITGWYKKKIQKRLFLISAIITITLNVDAIRLAEAFWKDDSLRAAMVAKAIEVSEDTEIINKCKKENGEIDLDCSLRVANERYREMKTMNLPIGWTDSAPTSVNGGRHGKECKFFWRFCIPIVGHHITPLTLLGWLVTTYLAAQGAPFWFELMNRFVNMRGNGAKPKQNKDDH